MKKGKRLCNKSLENFCNTVNHSFSVTANYVFKLNLKISKYIQDCIFLPNLLSTSCRVINKGWAYLALMNSCTVTINKTVSIWDNNGGATQSIPVRIERKERNKNRNRRVFEE